MYMFNRITVNPQLPKRIDKLSEIANNLWWSWNTDFLKLFKEIDIDLWENIGKNPVKFLKRVSQEKLENYANDIEFLKKYDKVVEDYENYINSKNTWFSKNYPENKNDLIAYFSAEYGLDQIIPIYSGGLGILSGDHLKAASDLGIPLIGVGLLYKNGYFHQIINYMGKQESIYSDIEIDNLPILPVKDQNGNDLIISEKIQKRRVYLKVWQINVGRIKLYLLDSDIPENTDDDLREITKRLYGGDQEMRIRQEIVLGITGTKLIKELGLKPTVYHMNEGHSAFLLLELMKELIEEKEIAFKIARDIVTPRTVFTTHTPVPAGNDIFPIDLMDKYFSDFWTTLGIEREEFMQLGVPVNQSIENGFNMGILALKIAGKKNGVSKLHGEVSRELFSDVWSDIAANESPITYVTNGIHTCSWLSPKLKKLYNKYLTPYWQDKIYEDDTWKKVQDIPNEELWNIHYERKVKLMKLVKDNVVSRLRRNGTPYDQIIQITSKLDPNALTIGFARRFATYKRATLIFRDIERITEILNNEDKPVQLIFAGKAHPNDVYAQEYIKYIHEISMKPQFKGRVFLLEDYDMDMARYLVSGVDVWLNNPRRPMEASGTSGQKASVNGVINFSILDGWWVEGYNAKNGWIIGTHDEYTSYDVQDDADSQSIYSVLENKIIPAYYSKENDCNYSNEWVQIMKNSIISTGGKYSTARMLVDYTEQLYIPLCNLYNKYFKDLENVFNYHEWKEVARKEWQKIKIIQRDNIKDITIDAGNKIEVNISVQVYSAKIMPDGTFEDIRISEMTRNLKGANLYTGYIELKTGGDYGYTFRVLPKHEMLTEPTNLNRIKWYEEEKEDTPKDEEMQVKKIINKIENM